MLLYLDSCYSTYQHWVRNPDIVQYRPHIYLGRLNFGWIGRWIVLDFAGQELEYQNVYYAQQARRKMHDILERIGLRLKWPKVASEKHEEPELPRDLVLGRGWWIGTWGR